MDDSQLIEQNHLQDDLPDNLPSDNQSLELKPKLLHHLVAVSEVLEKINDDETKALLERNRDLVLEILECWPIKPTSAAQNAPIETEPRRVEAEEKSPTTQACAILVDSDSDAASETSFKTETESSSGWDSETELESSDTDFESDLNADSDADSDVNFAAIKRYFGLV